MALIACSTGGLILTLGIGQTDNLSNRTRKMGSISISPSRFFRANMSLRSASVSICQPDRCWPSGILTLNRSNGKSVKSDTKKKEHHDFPSEIFSSQHAPPVSIGEHRSARPMLADWHPYLKLVKRPIGQNGHEKSKSISIFPKRFFRAKKCFSEGGSFSFFDVGQAPVKFFLRSLRTLPLNLRSRSFSDTPVIGHARHRRSFSGHGHFRSLRSSDTPVTSGQFRSISITGRRLQ